MTARPNVNVPLVDETGRPTSSLLDMISGLSAQDVVVDRSGRPTTVFRDRLQSVARTPLPSVAAALVNADGTPTRVMVRLLAELP